MYKIIKLNEENITQFKGKILQIISKCQTAVVSREDDYEIRTATFIWEITCLVEVEENI